VRDELWLRVLVIDGPVLRRDLLLRPAEPVPQSVAANLLLVSVNLALSVC
jgi:hypothetical protein